MIFLKKGHSAVAQYTIVIAWVAVKIIIISVALKIILPVKLEIIFSADLIMGSKTDMVLTIFQIQLASFSNCFQ